MDSVEVNLGNGWTYICCPRGERCSNIKFSAYPQCPVVAVDGACLGNGTVNARASAGVYFGPGSSFNQSSMLDMPRTTNQVAELMAAVLALEKALTINKTGVKTDMMQLVVKADS